MHNTNNPAPKKEGLEEFKVICAFSTEKRSTADMLSAVSRAPRGRDEPVDVDLFRFVPEARMQPSTMWTKKSRRRSSARYAHFGFRVFISTRAKSRKRLAWRT